MCSPPEKRTEGILTTVSGTFVAARQQESIDRKMQLCYKNRVVKKTDTGDWSNGMIGVSKTFGGSSILSSPAEKKLKARHLTWAFSFFNQLTQLTVTVHLANTPFWAYAYTLQVPVPTALIVPLFVTVATLGLSDSKAISRCLLTC